MTVGKSTVLFLVLLLLSLSFATYAYLTSGKKVRASKKKVAKRIKSMKKQAASRKRSGSRTVGTLTSVGEKKYACDTSSGYELPALSDEKKKDLLGRAQFVALNAVYDPKTKIKKKGFIIVPKYNRMFYIKRTKKGPRFCITASQVLGLFIRINSDCNMKMYLQAGSWPVHFMCDGKHAHVSK